MSQIKYIIIKIAVVIFIAEAAGMFILHQIFSFTFPLLQIFLDSSFLILISSPVIYLWIIKPYIVQQELADEALRNSNKELEKRVEERTQNLEQLNREIKRIYYNKTEFLSRVSHELRTPLNGILGFTQLMKSDPTLTPEQKQCMGYIKTSGNHLLSLINEVLNLSRVETGKIDLDLENINCVDEIQECVIMIDSLAKKSGIQMFEKYPVNDREVYVYCDKKRLKEVILNILSNAVKYNREDGEIIVSVERISSGRISINVEDTGDGIEEEKLPHLFEPFNRLGRQYGSIEGNGIGLAISRRIVEIMNGTLKYKKSSGGGSIFSVEFNESHKEILSEEEKKKEISAPGNAVGMIKKVLIIECSPSIIRLCDYLVSRRGGLEVFYAMESVYGIQLAKNKIPDLIFVEMDMPGTGGFEIKKELSACRETAHIPVIGIGLRIDKEYIEGLMKEGFVSYIPEPINLERFSQILDSHLK